MRHRAPARHTMASRAVQLVIIIIAGALFTSAAIETWFSGPDTFKQATYQHIAVR